MLALIYCLRQFADRISRSVQVSGTVYRPAWQQLEEKALRKRLSIDQQVAAMQTHQLGITWTIIFVHWTSSARLFLVHVPFRGPIYKLDLGVAINLANKISGTCRPAIRKQAILHKIHT
ncbi:unnamed protein product, partial [Protopolystoma xenopodis]